jgi:TonB family protein
VIKPDTPLRYQAVRPSDDYYPPQAIRRAAEGAAIVRACVDAAGRLSGTPTVVRSSRESLLDVAAIKWASEALRFQPATQGGVAIAACKEFRVSFTLH